MQTCVGSVAGLAFSGGFGSYLIGMDYQSYLNLGSSKGNSINVRGQTPMRSCSLHHLVQLLHGSRVTQK
jgi:hypothetical protein